MAKQDDKKRRKAGAATGPEAERLKLIGNWKENVQAALSKKRPKKGWPKGMRMIRFLSVVGFAFMSLAALAMPITYNFTVTATDGPLAGTTATGSFTYDGSGPSGGAIGLLTALNFTWHGITYNSTTANTGFLDLGTTGELVQVAFGNDCAAAFCSVTPGMDEWYAFVFPDGGGFAYSVPGGPFAHGVTTVTRVAIPASVPAIVHPAMLALLIFGLFGAALIGRKSIALTAPRLVSASHFFWAPFR